MSWKLVENPEYAGLTPRKIEAVCHDRSPFITVSCSFCGGGNHIHETQIAGAPDYAELEMRCANCGVPNVTTVSFVRSGFKKMRDEGWI